MSAQTEKAQHTWTDEGLNETGDAGWEGFTFREIHSADGDLVALATPPQARLIAAAPRLLQLAQYVVGSVDRGIYDARAFAEQARAAIKEATGE